MRWQMGFIESSKIFERAHAALEWAKDNMHSRGHRGADWTAEWGMRSDGSVMGDGLTRVHARCECCGKSDFTLALRTVREHANLQEHVLTLWRIALEDGASGAALPPDALALAQYRSAGVALLLPYGGTLSVGTLCKSVRTREGYRLSVKCLGAQDGWLRQRAGVAAKFFVTYGPTTVRIDGTIRSVSEPSARGICLVVLDETREVPAKPPAVSVNAHLDEIVRLEVDLATCMVEESLMGSTRDRIAALRKLVVDAASRGPP